jgi:hypothetical protein
VTQDFSSTSWASPTGTTSGATQRSVSRQNNPSRSKSWFGYQSAKVIAIAMVIVLLTIIHSVIQGGNSFAAALSRTPTTTKVAYALKYSKGKWVPLSRHCVNFLQARFKNSIYLGRDCLPIDSSGKVFAPNVKSKLLLLLVLSDGTSVCADSDFYIDEKSGVLLYFKPSCFDAEGVGYNIEFNQVAPECIQELNDSSVSK